MIFSAVNLSPNISRQVCNLFTTDWQTHNFTCKDLRSWKALSSILWIVLLCSINSSKFSSPERSFSLKTVILLYLKADKWQKRLQLINSNVKKKKSFDDVNQAQSVHIHIVMRRGIISSGLNTCYSFKLSNLLL